MMQTDPYAIEWQLYGMTPHEHRWMYNKLELAERLGYECYPMGVRVPAGEWCLRPIMNISGMSAGGHKKIILPKSNFVSEPSGYCVTPWLEAEHRHYVEYVNDEQIACYTGVRDGDFERYFFNNEQFPMPDVLRGISRYMLLEFLAGQVIDAAPRHMYIYAKDKVIDEHRRLIDPNYEPPHYAFKAPAEQIGMRVLTDAEGFIRYENYDFETGENPEG